MERREEIYKCWYKLAMGVIYQSVAHVWENLGENLSFKTNPG